MTYIIIYFILWVLTFIFYRTKSRNTSMTTFIMLSYVIYAFLSILLYQQYPQRFPNITLFPFIYLYGMLVLSLSPLIRYESKKITSISKIDNNLVYIIFSIFIIATIVVVPSRLSEISEGLYVLFSSDDGAKELYEEAHNSQTINANRDGGLVGYCNIVRYLLYEICVFLLFYYLTLSHRKKIIIVVSTLAISIDLIISLASGLRTTSTMSAFTIIITYMLFRPFIDVKSRKYIRNIGFVIGGIFIFLTTAVTVSRTIDRTGGAVEGLIDYAGQANLYFNEYALDANGLRDGDRTINYFKRLLGYDVPKSIVGVRSKHSDMLLNDGNFSTFVGDFVLDFGPWATPYIFAFLSIMAISITTPKNRKIRLDQLLIIQHVGIICMQGGMYLYNYAFSGNFITIMYIIMMIVFRFNQTNGCVQIKSYR